MAEKSMETKIESLKKDELVVLAKELGDKVKSLEASNDNATKAVAGLIGCGSLWGTDPQGQKYHDKNGKRMYIGTISFRVMLSKNNFKDPGSRQPDLRLVAMPFRPAQSNDDSDVFDELEGGQNDNPLL